RISGHLRRGRASPQSGVGYLTRAGVAHRLGFCAARIGLGGLKGQSECSSPLLREATTGSPKETRMAKLALVYGMRLFPAEELDEVMEATIKLKSGRTARVTMHLIEGSKKEIENTLQRSIEAFFEMYPEI